MLGPKRTRFVRDPARGPGYLWPLGGPIQPPDTHAPPEPEAAAGDPNARLPEAARLTALQVGLGPAWEVGADGLVRRESRISLPWDALPSPLVLIDLETTGVNPRTDRIIEVAAIRYEPGKPTVLLDTLVRNEELRVGPTHVHGVVPSMLVGAPTFVELLPALRAVCEGATMVAHNASFEHGFLSAELERAGGAWGLPRLCTVRLSHRLHVDRPKRGGHRLGDLAHHYEIPVVAAHRALGDVVMMAHLLIRMLARFSLPEQLPHVVQGELRPPGRLPLWPVEAGGPVAVQRRGPLS